MHSSRNQELCMLSGEPGPDDTDALAAAVATPCAGPGSEVAQGKHLASVSSLLLFVLSVGLEDMGYFSDGRHRVGQK